MQEIVICGAGGLGREVLEIFISQNKIANKWKILGFVDDTKSEGELINGFPVLGNIEWICNNHKKAGCIVAIGDARNRYNIIKKLEKYNINLVNAVHPSVVMSDSVEMGKNVIICAGCIFTVNITLGSHILINASTTIGHDVIVEDYCSIMPAVIINGNSYVMEGAYIGCNATIIQNINVGKWSVIGAGAVVLEDIPDRVTAVGIPARPIKTLP